MLNGGGAAEDTKPGRAPSPSGAIIVADSASACTLGSCENTCLFLRIDALMVLQTFAPDRRCR